MKERPDVPRLFSPRRALGALASAVGDVIPLPAYRRMIARELIGFVYHVISEQRLPYVGQLYPNKTPAMFEGDLLYLSKNFFLPGYDRLFAEAREKRSAEEDGPAAFITFDDGLAECSAVAGPMLARHRIPCIFFLVTECIDNRSMMYRHKVSLCINIIKELSESEWIAKAPELSTILTSASDTRADLIRIVLSLKERDGATIDRLCEGLGLDCRAYLERTKPYLTQGQIRELLRSGFKIGAHTRSHPFLAGLTADEMEAEIVGSCNEVRDITGDDQVPFAFPFSGAGIDRAFLAHLREKHRLIGPIFDTDGIAVDAPFVFNRVTADRPLSIGTSDSNIPDLLREAYRSAFVAGVRGMVPGFARS